MSEVPILMIIFFSGITWREFTKLRDQGARIYIDTGNGFVDMPQIALYWIYVIFAVIANVKVRVQFQDPGSCYPVQQ